MPTKTSTKDHDRWFKELISTFFEEFILGFFPEMYEYIDFQDSKFLSEELYTDILQGEKRRVDLLVETRMKGQDTLIIIHIEPQAYYQPQFSDRMFIYFSRLYEKYRRPIVPIAVFSYDKIKKEHNQLLMNFPFFQVLDFRFLKLELANMNWREYIKQPNPVAAALLSKMGYRHDERIQVKKEFLRLLVKLELDPARMRLIIGFFESYLSLTLAEDEQLQAEIEQLPKDEEVQIMEMISSWERRALEQGIEQGIIRGLTEGERKKALEVAAKMLEKGYDLELIKELTGLTESELEKLTEENN